MVVETLPLGPVGTNCFVVADEQQGRATVIDPGGDADQVLDLLDARGWTLEQIVATHAHFDHVGGVRPLVEATGAPFLAGEAELPALRVAADRALLAFGLTIPQPPDPDRLLRAGDTVTIAGRPFRVALTPGHSPGHICLIGEGVAFVGDVVFAGSIGRTDLPGGDYAALMRAIEEEILPLPDETVLYNGHGPATTVGRERATNPFLAGLMPKPR